MNEPLLLRSDSDTVSRGDAAETDSTAAGLAYYALSSVFFSAMGICTKQLGRMQYSVWQILFVRSVVIFCLSAGALRASGMSLAGNRRGWLLLRGTLGFGSITCFFVAVQRIPLADATTFTFLGPLVVALLAPALLRERLSAATAVAIPVCLGGVLLVAQPDFIFGKDSVQLDALGVAAACAQPLFSATAKMTVRYLRHSEAANVMVLYLMICTFVYSSVACAITHKTLRLPATALEVALLLGQAAAGYGNQICITKGLAKAKAAQAMSMQYLSIVVSQIAGMALFGEFTSFLGDVGMALILFTMLSYSYLESRRPAR